MTEYIEEEIDTRVGKIKITSINLSKIAEFSDSNFKFKFASHEEPLTFRSFPRLKESTYIYQNAVDLSKGARIYEDYADYKYTLHSDKRLILDLQSRQSGIKLTEFPTGVIMIEGKVIGQLMPYYDSYITLSEAMKNKINEEIFYEYLKKILLIFEELVSNDIFYLDIHAGNLMVNPLTSDVKLIDFEPFYIKFNEKDSCSQQNYLTMINRLKNLFTKLYELQCIELPNKKDDIFSFEELYEFIPSNDKQLRKNRV